jgi:hypothetical protein
MPSSGKWQRVAFISTDVSEESVASAFRRETIRDIGTEIVVPYCSSRGDTFFRSGDNVSRVKYELGFYIPEDGILHSHRRQNLKSYIALTGWTL